jgi:hypothetical protein
MMEKNKEILTTPLVIIIAIVIIASGLWLTGSNIDNLSEPSHKYLYGFIVGLIMGVGLVILAFWILRRLRKI